jgi:hypothetical protein
MFLFKPKSVIGAVVRGIIYGAALGFLLRPLKPYIGLQI